MACAAPMERHFFSSEEGAASSTGPRAFIARVASRRKLAAQGETYEQLLKRGGSSSDEVPAGSSSERDPLMPAPTGVEGRGRYVHGWLLWLGIASVACLPPLGVPSLLSLAVAGLFVLCWIATNIALKSLVCSFIYLALEIFFREIGSRNTYKVPPEGQPCLFVCAPHANQFLDPFVVMMALGRQDIHFLTAAASMRKWYVRYIANLLGVIPVERPQDGTVKGTGRVTPSPDDRSLLLGLGTRFRTEVKPGDTIAWAAEGGRRAGGSKGVVAEVVSDEAVRLKGAAPNPRGGQAGMWAAGEEAATRSVLSGMAEGDAFKITPHIDQASMFTAVTSVLAAGQSVGIFPEGGSHDRTSLLPLKAGIAVMALDAMAAHPGLQLKLVPIGLHYFSGHKFRSRVFLDIGEPLDVPPELLLLYSQDGESKRRATTSLMRVIETALAAVTVSAPDFDTLQFFWTLRRLIKTGSGLMSISQQVEFARRFAAAHEKLVAEEAARAAERAEGNIEGEDEEAGVPRASSQTEEVARLKEMSAEYNATLKSFGIRDYQVVAVMSHMGRGRAASLLAFRTLLLIVFIVCIAPMAILGLPLLIPRWYAARRARQAVASSSVKLEGRDVLATWKLMIALVLIPLMWIGYTAVVCAWSPAWGLPAPWDYEAGLLFFFFSPFFFYGAVLAGDRMALVARSLAPLATVILYPEARWALVEQRRELMQAMQALVDEHGWLEPDSRHADAAAGSVCSSQQDLQSSSHPGSGYTSST